MGQFKALFIRLQQQRSNAMPLCVDYCARFVLHVIK